MRKKTLQGALACTRLALLGEIPKQLRAVSLSLDKIQDQLTLNYFYDGEGSEEFLEDLSCVSTEAIACTGSFEIQNLIRIDYPNPIPNEGHFVYYRKEDSLPKFKKLKFEYDEFLSWHVMNELGEALLGKVTQDLLEVDVGVNTKINELAIQFYYDTQLRNEIRSLWLEIAREVSEALKKFPHTLNIEIKDAKYSPKEFTGDSDQRTAFRRKR